METAHARDAVMREKFWFRKDPFPRRSPRASPLLNGLAEPRSRNENPSAAAADASLKETFGPVEDEYRLMTIDEIINGTHSCTAGGAETSNNNNSNTAGGDGEYFPGLIPLVESYLDSVNIDVTTRCELARYLDLIRKRADGTLWTGAKWLREFVRTHPGYKFDSEVSEKIVYDLFKAVEEVGKAEGENGSVGWEMLTAKERAKGLDERERSCCG